ncbi:carboxypeptidase-like regulatory domain-containing protein [Flagellimonas pacifica]|uniref:carboxypeptidase-like regulatory domain-containing protein n=1 Tax=Flagellimonas pacifica TaxID=1247520 RepID=UPI0013FD504C|nr:carboxypeptidase-like regulatory domain-containing protein [Allomuricauda parva]
MQKVIHIIALIICSTGLAQSKIDGYIFDNESNEALPYCTIKIFGSITDHLITNQDGKFRLDNIQLTDSLEVRHLGFITKTTTLSYFKTDSILHLEMDVSALDEVVLTANEDTEYPYKLLTDVINQYRERRSKTISRAFLKLTSSARNIPIEQVEGFYNSEHSLAEGILDLRIKSGRFGQNRKFTYYSLDNTKILADFQLFETTNQILPQYPGNMNYEAIKRKYKVKIDDCPTCNDQEVSVSFYPKKANGRLFHGKILLDHTTLSIKKIELDINNPSTKALSSINENVKLTPKQIQLDIVFNPLDFFKIQYYDYSFQMNYEYENFSEVIDSNTFLYLYDYNTSFEEPYFTQKKSFNNDYDKIIALQASNDFWNMNYQFPKSVNDNRTTNFLKNNGYLINYNNYIPLNDIKYTDLSVIVWKKGERLKWQHLLQHSSSNTDELSTSVAKRDLTVGKSYDSPLSAHKDRFTKDNKIKLFISYMVDRFVDKEGSNKTVSRTLLDIESSQFGNNRTRDKLAFVNMAFDIYEIYRQLANSRIKDQMNFEEAKAIFDEVYQGASIEVKKMRKETNDGANPQGMTKWNNRIKAKLGVNNLALD